MADKDNGGKIVKLTGARMSKSFDLVASTLLEGHSVPLELIMGVPEIRDADRMMRNVATQTSLLDQRPRAIMHEGILAEFRTKGSYKGKDSDGKADNTGTVARGHEVHFILGLPASGKTSVLTNMVSGEFSAKVIDINAIAREIPEYANGWGAHTVREEAGELMSKAFEESLALGENVVVPRIGEPPECVIEMMEAAKQAGYTCHVHLMDLDPNKALGRAMMRFAETGEYIPPSEIARYNNAGMMSLMTRQFMQLTHHQLCDGYTLWSNDVAQGDSPVLLEYSGISGRFLDNADIDQDRIIGVTEDDTIMAAIRNTAIDGAVHNDRILEAKQSRNTEAARADMLEREIEKAKTFEEWLMKSYSIPDAVTRSGPRTKIIPSDIPKDPAGDRVYKPGENKILDEMFAEAFGDEPAGGSVPSGPEL